MPDEVTQGGLGTAASPKVPTSQLTGPGRTIAAGEVTDNQLVVGFNAVFEGSSGKLTFKLTARERFVVLLTPIRAPSAGVPYITQTTYVREIGADYVFLNNTALDTGGRVFPADNFYFAVVALD